MERFFNDPLEVGFFHPGAENPSWILAADFSEPSPIEADLRLLLEQIHRDSDPSIALACERLVRCYDPCISCSTHFLKVKIQRE